MVSTRAMNGQSEPRGLHAHYARARGRLSSKQYNSDDEYDSLQPQLKPWEPSAFVPEFPLEMLYGNKDASWEIQRQTELYSNAPIPALLHVCKEPRRFLQDEGYELAFGTRTTIRNGRGQYGDELDDDNDPNEPGHGGRTWFNFAKDTLYVGHTEFNFPNNFTMLSEEDLSSLDLFTAHLVDKERRTMQRTRARCAGEGLPWDVTAFLPRDLKE